MTTNCKSNRPRVVICDDAPTIRMLIASLLAPHYDCLTIESGAETLQKAPDFAPNLIITDLMMEGMDGIELCRAIKVDPRLKRVPVILLTVKADTESRAMGLESGADDYLYKPIRERELLARTASLVKLHLSTIAETELLEKTLNGSVKMLCELLAMTNPETFGRSVRARQLVIKMVGRIEVENHWPLEVAAMLSQIAHVALSPAVTKKIYLNQPLSEQERNMVARLPVITEELLANIPRLEPVREILLNIDNRFDGADKKLAGESIPLGARLLRIALDYDVLDVQGVSAAQALVHMRGRTGIYDPILLEVLAKVLGGSAGEEQVVEVQVAELRSHMVLVDDVLTNNGVMLVSRGQEVTASMITRLENFAPHIGVRQPIRVRLPQNSS